MWILPLLLCAWLVEPRSSGIVMTGDKYGCDFEDPAYKTQWGCQSRTWNASNDFTFARGFCQDANFNGGKFMWWVAAPLPVPSDEFSMRTGDGDARYDTKTYVPGRYVSVYIRTLKFDNMYKGLLLFAKNSNNSKIGDWIVPLEASPQFASFAPNVQICPQSVMHVNAEDKPYVAKFTFVAPPAGSGTITIKAMLKTGPPNPTSLVNGGSFFRMPDIVLEEAKPNDVKKWVLLNDTSCKDYCNSTGQEACSDSVLSSTMDGIIPNPLDQVYPCHGAVFHDCTGNPRAELPSRFCTYHPSNCSTGASCTMVPSGTPLFCLCGKAPMAPPQLGASARLVPGFGALVALLSMSVWGSKTQMAWATLALLLAGVPTASAHNWMEGTRGRASNLGANQFCSPTFPQVNRNAIHLQVAQEQNFVVEWAAAHGDYTYWIIIHDDARANVSKLTRNLMDSWLAACPGGGFANTTALGMKYHRFRPNFNLEATTPVNGQSASSPTYAQVFKPDPIYNGSVWDKFSLNGGRPSTFYQSDPYSIAARSGSAGPETITPFNASLYPKTMLAEYNPQYLLDDRRCTYTNGTNPWIHTIHRYRHHDVLAAFATAVMSIPVTPKGPGRYQVHYKWSSYCDVMDVDVRAKSAGPVVAPYGIPINSTQVQFDVAHHCWFEKPRAVGQCFEVVTSPAQCQAICSADNACKGFQMLPLQLDTSQGNGFGLFPESSYIPWASNVGFCDKSQFSKSPKSGSMACYPIYQFQDDFNSARPLWSFTDDTDHQGFYGTCYLKPRSLTWLTVPSVTVDPLDEFRFLSKCIPCDNIGQDVSNPRWGPQQDYCVDCGKYPTPAKARVTVPEMTSIGAGTFMQSAHWLSPGGTPIAFKDECAVLAARDSTCSKYVMYSDYRAQRYGGKIQGMLPNSLRVNGTAGMQLINGTKNWHYSAFSLQFSYYRSCACLDSSVNVANGAPEIDDTMATLACDGVVPAQCIFRNFTVFKLA